MFEDFSIADFLAWTKEMLDGILDHDPVTSIIALLFIVAVAIVVVATVIFLIIQLIKGMNKLINSIKTNRRGRTVQSQKKSLEEQIRQLEKKLAERNDFIKFIEYMFLKDFTILPKICLAVDGIKQYYHKFDIRKLTVTYEYDFSKWDDQDPSDKEIDFEYDSQVKFEMQVNNRDLPNEYIRYAGNMYANELVPVYQKHGNSSEFTKVGPQEYRAGTEIKADIAKYSWELSRNKIGAGPVFSMEYYWDYKEKWKYKDNKAYKETGNAEGKGILIHYPIHYGTSIDEFEIIVIFKGCRVKVKDMIVEKIGKIGKAQTYGTTQIIGDKKWIADNQISFSFTPKVNKCEAIYAKVEWLLREDDKNGN